MFEPNKMSRGEYNAVFRKWHALSWLEENHIVVGLLPEVGRVKDIANNEVRRVYALGCLDFLSEDPESDAGAYAAPTVAIFAAFIAATALGINSLDGLFGNDMAVLLVFLNFGAASALLVWRFSTLQRRRDSSRAIAAWAKAWGAAIRAHS